MLCVWRGETGFSAVEPCVFFSPLLTFLYFMNKYILLPLARVLSRSPFFYFSSTVFPFSSFWFLGSRAHWQTMERRGCAPKSYFISHTQIWLNNLNKIDDYNLICRWQRVVAFGAVLSCRCCPHRLRSSWTSLATRSWTAPIAHRLLVVPGQWRGHSPLLLLGQRCSWRVQQGRESLQKQSRQRTSSDW